MYNLARMKTGHRPKRAAYARDLALAFLGATNATDIRLQVVIDRHMTRVLDASDGNLSLAAKLLGMHRRSLQRYKRKRGQPARRRRKRARRAR
jgi:ActR/RegA family two-component response regulator